MRRPAAPPALGHGASRATTLSREELSALARRSMSDIAARTGVGYRGRVTLVFAADDAIAAEGHDASTWALAMSQSERFAWQDELPMSQMSCTIYLRHGIASAAPASAHEVIAHEMFHCFVYQNRRGMAADYTGPSGPPAWVKEGTAAWVGATLSGVSGAENVDSWWRVYLSGNRTTESSTDPTVDGYRLDGSDGYSAIGFYEYLAQRGVDVWHKLLPATNDTADAAYQRLTGGNDRLMSEWASTTTRLGGSSSWDMTGPGITGDRRSPSALALETARVQAPGKGNRVVQLVPGAGIPYAVVTVDGPGRLRVGSTDQDITNGKANLCLGERCSCPNGRPPFGGAPFVQVPSGERVTVGFGGKGGGPSRLSGAPLTEDEVCQDAAPKCYLGAWELDRAQEAANIKRLTPFVVSVSITGHVGLTIERDLTARADVTATYVWTMATGRAAVNAEAKFVGNATATYLEQAQGLYSQNQAGEIRKTLTRINGSTGTANFGTDPGFLPSGEYVCGPTTLKFKVADNAPDGAGPVYKTYVKAG